MNDLLVFKDDSKALSWGFDRFKASRTVQAKPHIFEPQFNGFAPSFSGPRKL